MDRRSFLLAAAAAPLALRGHAFAYVTADTEARVAIVDLRSGAVLHRIATKPGPRSVERVGGVAVVAHTAVGAVSIIDELGVRHEVAGFEEPRYTAGSRSCISSAAASGAAPSSRIASSSRGRKRS